MSRTLPGFFYKDGRVSCEVIIPGTGGRRRKRNTFDAPDIETARQIWAANRKAILEDGVPVQVPTFAAYVSTSWPIATTKPLSTAIAKEQKAFVDRELIPRFGHLRLDQITGERILALQRDLVAKGLSSATVNNRMRIIHKILAFAVQNGRMPKCPPFPPALRTATVEVCVPDAAIDAYLRHFDHPASRGGAGKGKAAVFFDQHVLEAKPFFIVAVRTGMSRIDLINLRWASVDLVNGVIRARRQKTDEPFEVALTYDAVAALTALRCRALVNSEFVFATRSGKRYSETTVVRYHRRACTAAGIDIPFKGWRHLFAKRLASRGASAYLLKTALGHTNIRTSQGYVGRLAPEGVEVMREMLNRRTS
jgi:integrase